MAEHRIWLLVSLFLAKVLFLEASKILTMGAMGVSHYRLMNQVSQILQDHGHDVTILLYEKVPIPDLKKENMSYESITWCLPEDQQMEFDNRSSILMEELCNDRFNHHIIIKVYKYFADICSHLLSRKDIMDSLRKKNFDLLFLDAAEPCVFLIAEKLEKPFVAFLPMPFSSMDFGLPSPLSYVPVYGSRLTDKMDFWGRVKNFLMFFDFSMKQRRIFSQYDATIQEHFAEGSRPVLSDLLLKAELWFVNSDFAFEFARPLLPNTVYVGGLMDKPARPLPQV